MNTINIKHITRSIILPIILSVTTITASAQVSSLYHLKTVATRHELNPSFRPLTNTYFSVPALPVMSGFYVGAGNNSLSFEDVLYPKTVNGEKKTIWFFNKDGNTDDFYNRLKNTTRIYAEADIRLFAFGTRLDSKQYITFGLTQKMNAGIFIPKDFMKLLIYGTPDMSNVNSFNFDRFGISSNLYTELAFGYSREIDKKLTVGGKLKILLGQANTSTKIDRFRLNAAKGRWDFDIKGTVNASAPNVEYELDEENRIEDVNLDGFEDFGNWKMSDFTNGFGAAIDLGGNYKLLDDKLLVSASLLDLGFIRWKAENAANMPVDGHFEFEGIELEAVDGTISWDDDYFDNITDNIHYSTTFKPYTTALAAKVLLGAEYGILNHKITFGALSKSTIMNKSIFQEITASANFFPADYFNAALSYSLLNGRFGTVGLALGGRLGPVNMYFAGDYLPLNYSKQYIPYKNKAFNLQFGLLFNIGYSAKKNADDDNDGVQNRKDKCPDTPANTPVDKYGCPVENSTDAPASIPER